MADGWSASNQCTVGMQYAFGAAAGARGINQIGGVVAAGGVDVLPVLDFHQQVVQIVKTFPRYRLGEIDSTG